MKINWDQFNSSDYAYYLSQTNQCDEHIGSIYVGDICVELIAHDDENQLSFELYVAGEDTGYGNKNGIAYDYADGFDIVRPYCMPYGYFKNKVENLLFDYIKRYKGSYNLINHATRPLRIW